MGDVGHDTGVDLHLDVVDGGDVGLLLDVAVFEIDLGHVALRNDIGTEQEGGQGNDAGRNHVGAEQAAETHARALHGDDFGVGR